MYSEKEDTVRKGVSSELLEEEEEVKLIAPTPNNDG